jgi:autotransporter-associated beta strand protein
MAVAIFSLTCGSALAQTTNTVTNGGTINVGVTEVITNPVTSITAAITNNGSLQFWQSTALTDSGVISGFGTVTKATGSGDLTLSGANTFSGKLTVSSGRLNATGVSDTVGSGLGLGTQVELGQSANLQVTVGAGTTNTTTRSLILNGNGTLGASTGTLVWNGNVTNNGTSGLITMAFNSGAAGTNVFGGVIGNTTNNTAVNLNFQSTQIWSLTGSNTFSGVVTIGGGRVIADKLANSGTASSIGTAAQVRLGYFNNAPSVFEYVGSGSTNNMQVRLGASAGTGNNAGSFLHNGTGVLMLTNTTFTLESNVQAANMSRVLVLGGTNAADNTIAGNVTVNTGGKLLISADNQVLDSSAITLSGGTIQRGAGVSEVFGDINITSASTLDFGSGVTGTFQFQTYANAGLNTLTLANFAAGNKLQFLGSSFNAGNLAQLSFGSSMVEVRYGTFPEDTQCHGQSDFAAQCFQMRQRFIGEVRGM